MLQFGTLSSKLKERLKICVFKDKNQEITQKHKIRNVAF